MNTIIKQAFVKGKFVGYFGDPDHILGLIGEYDNKKHETIHPKIGDIVKTTINFNFYFIKDNQFFVFRDGGESMSDVAIILEDFEIIYEDIDLKADSENLAYQNLENYFSENCFKTFKIIPGKMKITF
jgi:hypothetical protein